ncbi:SBBP repeat-containing protein, partial [bacterium]|nr:SBBP repeat-containing protein [bacterium]
MTRCLVDWHYATCVILLVNRISIWPESCSPFQCLGNVFLVIQQALLKRETKYGGQMITEIRTARFSSIVFFIFLSSLTLVESAQLEKAPTAPTLIYSTYLGGGIADQIWAMTVDAAGYVYVTGYTASSNLPVINALQPNYAGQGDGFVAKFKPDGTPVYITYLGGTYLDSAQDIAVDSAGNAYITGWTGSTDFPTVNAFQPNYAGVWDAFVCKISSDGSTLIYSSY